jgi:hypothetical protein
VDLFGEQAVQVITTVLQVACVLLAAMVVVLSVRRMSAGFVPARRLAPVQSCLAQVDGLNRLPQQALHAVLPARAPPDPVESLPRGRMVARGR